ncbi:MAG: GTP cyclohydrolase I FolE2 [Bordetella sp.]|nr:MAG: GTP cyclohydrolase I FolE2 [Bordetella sp.]
MSKLILPDIQSLTDARHIPIRRVGIRNIRHPIIISNSEGLEQSTIAYWTLTVSLSAKEKGTHMSRFMTLLELYRKKVMTPFMFCEMSKNMLEMLSADCGDINAIFPYFINKSAPVSKVKSLLDYEVKWIARATNKEIEFEVVIQIPVTSLCPCSKAISKYGAHNQRSNITISLISSKEIKMEQIIRLVENEASCELWSLLKRPDERYVTEYAYNNPKFVEDLVRDIAIRLNEQNDITWYRIEAENFESIHNHSAYAVIES